MKNNIEKKSLSITIDPDINDKLDKLSINKSKLINLLLKKHLDKLSKK